jgi:excinuclease ABC subunit C
MSSLPSDKSKKGIQTSIPASMPNQAGVYLHKDKHGKIIYVGKAINLKNRVSSYFQTSKNRPARLQQLVNNIDSVDFIVTDSEERALVLENQLIKEYRPHYNVQLKDGKQYPYIKITLSELWPKVEIVRQISKGKDRYFGPYTSVHAMYKTVNYILKIFKIRTCHLALTKNNSERACLDYQIGKCSAPCAGIDNHSDYLSRVNDLIHFLDGSNSIIISRLQTKMSEHATQKEYEQAAQCRDQLALLNKTISGYNHISGLSGSLDSLAVARDGKNACGVVLRIRDGHLLTSHHFVLNDKLLGDDPVLINHLLREYYSRTSDYPDHIALPQDIPDSDSWASHFSKLNNKCVTIGCAQRGARLKAVKIATDNATWRLNEFLSKSLSRRSVKPGKTVDLQKALELEKVPKTIECFDISNFQGKETVASLVFFKDGKPLKTRYRKFRVKTVEGIDDYASMREVIYRYYKRLIDNGSEPADLVIVDGGKGQLSSARTVLTELGLHSVELIGLAKKKEEIIRENKSILSLPLSSPALQLLQNVRDEAHRFAITYHRQLRAKGLTRSALDEIPGIGQVKKMSLLHHFDSVENIKSASLDSLSEVRGLNKTDLIRIYEYFNSGVCDEQH